VKSPPQSLLRASERRLVSAEVQFEVAGNAVAILTTDRLKRSRQTGLSEFVRGLMG